ncbi:winged helix-turn-helix domain-containing protein [Pseudomonas profundi]|uniref:winged helix-turn-helix domain-containing protein n=1 Tax=Pseudomonas profundi TaxID=1981513 RepID=UPI00123AF16E|nr:winged helix-turn-helix domain-containing protein [Pseudomonas profundi]
MNAPLIPASSPSGPVTYLVLKTGSTERTISFYPSMYQLLIQRGEQEERVDLGYAGSRLLERLLQAPGEVVSREELMSYAWPDRVVGQGSLNQQIYSLRQLFCDEKGREIIQTLPRRGYQFNPHYVAERRAAEPAAPASSVEPEEPTPSVVTDAARPARSHWPAIGLFILTLLVGLGTSAWIRERPENLATRSLERGALTLQLMAKDGRALDSLERDSAGLFERLASLSEGASLLTLDRHGGYYQLFCHRETASVNWLMFHANQLNLLDDKQLKQCLL